MFTIINIKQDLWNENGLLIIIPQNKKLKKIRIKKKENTKLI